MGIVDKVSINEESVQRYSIMIENVVVVNCHCSQRKNSSFNYVIKVENEELYTTNKDYCDIESKKFIDRVVQVNNSPSTTIEVENNDERYSII